MKRTLQTLSILLVVGLMTFSYMSQAIERVVIYSWPKSMHADERGSYPIELLKLALSKSDHSFVARPSEFAMSQYRTLKQLELGVGIDVVWTMTNLEREQQLRPIRIPIDRGLIGWRLLAIKQQEFSVFQNLLDENELRNMLTVQGTDWPDFTILQSNGFKVVPSNYFEGMYRMLQMGRIRFFARSLTEITPELISLKDTKTPIVVAPRWVLHYPAALYFFVRKGDDELAQAIEKGLEVAIADGSMKQLFLQHFQTALDSAKIYDRQVVSLTNITLPHTTPIKRMELWYDPVKGY